MITENIKSLIKPRQSNSSKFDYGHALIIAGNLGKMGCAVIASKACLRSGLGMLTVNVPKEERLILQTSIPEAMLVFRENATNDFNYYTAIGIGPGIGVSKGSTKLLTDLLMNFNNPLLIDADALTILSKNKNLMQKIPARAILTPHSKEFDRLFGVHKNTDDRITTAIQKAKEHSIIIILKGNKTLITDGVDTFFNNTGNAGLAKGGSGDALSGIITSLLAQNYDPFIAAKIAVTIHGLAADIAMENQSLESLLISDVIKCIGKAFKQILK